ncbi:hypothetical protein BGY98DRAFT_681073 [Russula aff. rugulosa BPL654]|nr:hypothetical protein BGY98DRAFT_681073 [Russula aff. rugulosa BPL654]
MTPINATYFVSLHLEPTDFLRSFDRILRFDEWTVTNVSRNTEKQKQTPSQKLRYRSLTCDKPPTRRAFASTLRKRIRIVQGYYCNGMDSTHTLRVAPDHRTLEPRHVVSIFLRGGGRRTDGVTTGTAFRTKAFRPSSAAAAASIASHITAQRLRTSGIHCLNVNVVTGTLQ